MSSFLNPKAYTQNRRKGAGFMTLRRTTGAMYHVVIITKSDGKKSYVNLSQLEINRLAKYLDYHRTDKSNDYMPSDEQVDAWVKAKGLKYAENSGATH